jgi:hypothetical protein
LAIPARILLPLAAAPLAASCFVFQCGPYKCREAVEGRALYAPVLAAIENYHRDKAVYPEVLADLVPVYIENIPISANEDGPKFPEYERAGDTLVDSQRRICLRHGRARTGRRMPISHLAGTTRGPREDTLLLGGGASPSRRSL